MGKVFSDRLKKAMDDRGHTTQGELELRSGISQSIISRALSGESMPSVDRAAKLARALGVSLDWLCDLPMDPPGRLEPDQERLLELYGKAKERGLGDTLLGTAELMAGEKPKTDGAEQQGSSRRSK